MQWKRARGILLKKGGKRDFGLVPSYCVICLLNCIGKVVEKVVAKELSQYWEDYSKLHQGQMCNAVARAPAYGTHVVPGSPM